MCPAILEPVLPLYHQLEHLNLSSYVEVIDQCLSTVAKLTSSRLLSIELMRIQRFRAPGVMSLLDFTSLQDVDLSTFCTEVRNAEVIAIRELKHLQKLKLCACWNITDVGLSVLSSCKRADDVGLNFVLELEMVAPRLLLPVANSFAVLTTCFRFQLHVNLFDFLDMLTLILFLEYVLGRRASISRSSGEPRVSVSHIVQQYD
jgi:hypothetical protein